MEGERGGRRERWEEGKGSNSLRVATEVAEGMVVDPGHLSPGMFKWAHQQAKS